MGDYDEREEESLNKLDEIHSKLEEIRYEIENNKFPEINSRLDQIRSEIKDINQSFTGFLVIVSVIVLLEAWPGSKLDRWTDKVWHSFKDDTEFQNIQVAKRPHDCDYFYAPIGDKACEYKKQVVVFGPKERQSLMNAKTTEMDRQAAAREPNAVRIFWEKQEK